MKDDDGLYYENAETNNIIWRRTCNEWRISNDSNHNGKCDEGEPLNFNEGEITQNCIISSIFLYKQCLCYYSNRKTSISYILTNVPRVFSEKEI